jgi:hypothetical protein
MARRATPGVSIRASNGMRSIGLSCRGEQVFALLDEDPPR